MNGRLSRTALTVVTDLDGTIVHDERVSPATISALAKLSRLGIPVILATARTPDGLWLMDTARDYCAAAVCCNGAIGLQFGADDDGSWLERISARDVLLLRSFLSKNLPDAGIGVYDGKTWALNNEYLSTRGRPPSGTHQVVLDPLLSSGAVAVQIVHPRKDAARLASEIDGDSDVRGAFEISHGQSMILDLLPAGTNKGKGVRRMIESLGRSPENAIAFGDAENDLPVFLAVGTSVAMGNAEDLFRSQADEVTVGVLEDGFARYVADVILPSLN